MDLNRCCRLTCMSARLMFHSCSRPFSWKRSTTATFLPFSSSAVARKIPRVPPRTTTSYVVAEAGLWLCSEDSVMTCFGALDSDWQSPCQNLSAASRLARASPRGTVCSMDTIFKLKHFRLRRVQWPLSATCRRTAICHARWDMSQLRNCTGQKVRLQ